MTNLTRCLCALAPAFASLAAAPVLCAATITVPTGLTAGEQYRLIFVTADSYTATSSDISDYNNDVNTEADSVAALSALDTTWLDLGSTATESAIDNIGIDSGVPIYDLEGHLIATDAGTTPGGGGLFSNGMLIPAIGLDYDENGTKLADSVAAWTGTYVYGTSDSGHNPLGSAASVVTGSVDTNSGFWIAHTVEAPTTENRLYAISEVITVGAPEPGSVALMSLGAAALLLCRRYSRQPRS